MASRVSYSSAPDAAHDSRLPGSRCAADPACDHSWASTQLYSLLCYCHGNGPPQQEDAGPEHRGNVFWLASELAREVMNLIQVCIPRER